MSWFSSSTPKRAPCDDVPTSTKEEKRIMLLNVVITQKLGEKHTPDARHLKQLTRSLHREKDKTFLPKALKWYEEDVAWRKEIQPELFVSNPSKEFRNIISQYPYYIYGQDRKGHPVWYDCIPESSSLVEKLSQKTLMERHLRPQEQMKVLKEYLRTNNECNGNNELYQHVYVLDVGNAGWGSMSSSNIENIKTMFSVLKSHYVEVTDMIYIVNASFAFRATWKIISPFVDEGTREKVKVYGSGYLEKLLKRIDINQIPKRFGGQAKAPLSLGEVVTLDAYGNKRETKETIDLEPVCDDKPSLEFVTSISVPQTSQSPSTTEASTTDTPSLCKTHRTSVEDLSEQINESSLSSPEVEVKDDIGNGTSLSSV